MPKRKVNRTIRAGGKGKGRRDATVRSMAKSTINRGMRKPRPSLRRKINRGDALFSMMSSMGSGMSSVGQAAYSSAMPLASSMAESVGQSVSKFASEHRVPTVPNNPSWVNLKDGLEKGLIKLGLLGEDVEIDPAIYFQSVERFLDFHKKTKINKDHINRVEMSFRSMPSAMLGDHTPDTMGEYFGKGITHKAIISALNYGFHEILVDDLDIDPESQSTPGKGFQAAREKTAKQQKMAKIINLSRGIRILLGTDDKLGHYKDTIEEKFKELQGLITTDQELEVLKMLVKNYPELKDLMEIQSRKKKKTRRRKKKKKQTKRRKKK
jgi:hypothetical protein